MHRNNDSAVGGTEEGVHAGCSGGPEAQGTLSSAGSEKSSQKAAFGLELEGWRLAR